MQAEVNRSNIDKLSHKDQVRFALFCAKQVALLTNIPEAKKCIDVAELWLEGKATEEECRAAAGAANAAANAAAAAGAAANAAYAAHAAAAAAHAADAANVATSTHAVYAAANAAAAYAAADAAAAAHAAANANAAGADIIKQKQMEYLYELVYKNEIVEQTLLNT